MYLHVNQLKYEYVVICTGCYIYLGFLFAVLINEHLVVHLCINWYLLHT